MGHVAWMHLSRIAQSLAPSDSGLLHHGFGHPLSLIVARSRPNRVDIAPVVFLLGVDLQRAARCRCRGGDERDSKARGGNEMRYVKYLPRDKDQF